MSASIQSIRVGCSGRTLIVRFADGTGAPTNFSSLISGDEQRITIAASGGTFTLTFQGQTTSPLSAYTKPETVQAALEALSTIGTGNVTVRGMNPYTVTFVGALDNAAQPAISINSSSLLSSPPVNPTTAGTTPALFIDDLGAGFSYGPVPSSFGSNPYVDSWEKNFHYLQYPIAIPGIGNQWCSWTATGLAAGCYKVEIFSQYTADRGTNNKFRVFDGTSYHRTLTVDLTGGTVYPKANYTDTQGDTLEFWTIGTAYCGSGTLKIIWYDDSNAVNFVADTIRLSPATGDQPPTVAVVATNDHTPGGPPAIAINGGSAVQLLYTAGDYSTGFPYVVFPIPSPTVVAPTDGVTFTAKARWAITAAGDLPAATGIAVTNGVGTPLFPRDPSGAKTLKVGWNTALPLYWDAIRPYANLVKGSSYWSGTLGVDFTLDANGDLATGSSSMIVVGNSSNLLMPGGYASHPPQPGRAPANYTLMWDGTGDVYLQSDVTVTENVPLRVTGQATNNRRVYALGDPVSPNLCPTFITLHPTAPATNLRLYTPGTPTDGSAKFHPEYLRMLSGAYCLRAMGPLHGADSNVVNYSQYAKSTQRTLLDAKDRFIQLTIQRIESYADPTQFLQGFCILCTTSVAHGLVSGQIVHFPGDVPSDDLILSVTTPTGASQINIRGDVAMVLYDSARMTSSQFAISLWQTADNGQPITAVTTWTGTGHAFVMVGNGQPPEDHVDLCNAVGAEVCWMNVSQTATDACVTELAQMIATRLNPGRKCAVEVSNETWNWAFPSNGFYNGMARVWGLPNNSGSQAFARHSAHIHDLFATAFAAAGRATDLIRIMPSHWYGQGVTSEICTWCTANGKTFDWLAIAPYYDNAPRMLNGTANAPESVLDTLTVDQVMDVAELSMQLGTTWGITMPAIHRAILLAAFPTNTPTLVSYEGGPAYGFVGGSSSTVRMAQSQGWHRHPRQRGIITSHFQQLQDAGLAHHVLYMIGGIHGDEIGDGKSLNTACYNAYCGWDQLAGVGDGSDGRFDNRTSLYDLTQVVSVVGGAVVSWNALVGTPPPAPTEFASVHASSPLASAYPVLGPLATSGTIPTQTTSFDPSTLTGLVLWLKADSLTLGEGDPVATWDDHSVHGNHATATGTARPTFRANALNGKPAVAFDGTTNLMKTAAPVTLAADNFSMIVVVAMSAGHADYAIHLSNGRYTDGHGYALSLKAYSDRSIGFHYGSGPWGQTGVVAIQDQYNLVVHVRSSGVPAIFVNGIVRSLTASVGILTDPPNMSLASGEVTYLGAGDEGNLFATCRIAEVLIYEQALSGTDRASVEGYLNAKYNIY